MCGRYATSRTADALVQDFGAKLADGSGAIEVDYNVAPTKTPPLVIGRTAAEGGSLTRELTTARWGLVPAWAKDPSIGNRLINARAETVADKPAFRKAFAKRRALVPVDGFYEWFAPTTGPKQPFFLSEPGGLALAGLYEFWRADGHSPWLLSFTILTTAAEGADGRIHDRAPMLVDSSRWDAWLAPSPNPDDLAALVPATPGRLTAWPVSTAVNNVRNNGPELVVPLEHG
jgi:putative SOS response-associated peptidase YedK